MSFGILDFKGEDLIFSIILDIQEVFIAEVFDRFFEVLVEVVFRDEVDGIELVAFSGVIIAIWGLISLNEGILF